MSKPHPHKEPSYAESQTDIGDRDFDADRAASMAANNSRHAKLSRIAHGSGRGSVDTGVRSIGARVRSEPYSGEVSN